MRKRYEMIVLVVLSFFIASCVKEDRTACPCCLRVWTEKALSPYTVLYAYQEDFPKETAAFPLVTPTMDIDFWLTRKILTVNYVRTPETMRLEDGAFRISYGMDCDSLFARSTVIDCSQEFARDTLRLHKNFASVRLSFKDSVKNVYPVVTGSVCGMQINGLKPLAGDFMCRPGRGEDGSYLFRLPRQKDDSLVLEVYDLSEKKISSVRLGKEIIQRRYDWTAKDLADIEINLDLKDTSMEILVRPWLEGDSYNVNF